MPETPRLSLFHQLSTDARRSSRRMQISLFFSFFDFSFLFKETILNWNIYIIERRIGIFQFRLETFFFSFSASREPLGLSIQRRTRALHKSVWTMESRKLANEKVSRRGIERAPARWSSSFKRFSTPFLLVSRAFRTPASSISSS